LTLHEEIWKQLKKENKKKNTKGKKHKMLLFLFACEYKTFDVFLFDIVE